MATRHDVLAFAATHGAKAAGEHYGIPAGTIRSWRSRAKQRAARDGTDPPPPTPAERWLAEARQLAERYAKGLCLHCGDAGTVDLSLVTRGGLLVRPGRRIPCPTCGGHLRRITVTEWPRREWTEAMARAGDLGLGWQPDEWARIRAGELDPDGRRITGRPDA
jgi:hypothetical protein